MAKKKVEKKTVEKRPVGRPRTTIDDLPQDWKEIMRACGQSGGSMTKARALLGIAMSAWETLLEDSEEFREAEKVRETLSAVWWEDAGQAQVTDGKGNATTWIFNMKNRFDWRDKSEVNLESPKGTMSPVKNSTIEELRAEAAALGLPPSVFGS